MVFLNITRFQIRQIMNKIKANPLTTSQGFRDWSIFVTGGEGRNGGGRL